MQHALKCNTLRPRDPATKLPSPLAAAPAVLQRCVCHHALQCGWKCWQCDYHRPAACQMCSRGYYVSERKKERKNTPLGVD